MSTAWTVRHCNRIVWMALSTHDTKNGLTAEEGNQAAVDASSVL